MNEIADAFRTALAVGDWSSFAEVSHTRDGLVREHVVYCSGRLRPAARERIANESALIRL